MPSQTSFIYYIFVWQTMIEYREYFNGLELLDILKFILFARPCHIKAPRSKGIFIVILFNIFDLTDMINKTLF